MLKITLFGQFNLHLEDQPVELSSRPAQTLLAYLLLNRTVTHQRARLAGLLWPDTPESSARQSLRNALWQLRRAIGNDYLLADRTTLAFNTAVPHTLDVAILERDPVADDPEELIQVVSVYKGELLPGFYEDWVLLERERLQSLFERRMQALLDGLLAGGRWRQVQTWAERWLALGHVPEPAYRALMMAHAALGDRAGMADSYRRCLQALEEELDVAPSPETQALYEQLSEGDESLARPGQGTPQAEVAPDETLAPVTTSQSALPTYATPFVGREEELVEIGRLLQQEPDCRLLTLVGPGGVGKTRLALAVASELVDVFPQGIYFVSLLPVSEAEFIVTAVAEALDFSFSGGMDPKLQLLNHLRGRRLLLMLDNFEHLLLPPLPHPGDKQKGTTSSEPEVESSTELLSQILKAAPEVTLLITSRERLKLQEEWSYEVQGLSFPESGDEERLKWRDLSSIETDSTLQNYSAVHLFVQRARQAKAGFDLTAGDMPHVARICQLVEGMPLGLELAAPWVRLMSCREIAREIERNLHFLTATLRNVPDRHRSLRAILEQTWQRLPEAERVVLSKLSVFKGGCPRQAAEQVADASLPVLASLVDKALLRHTHRGRYELHELVRHFAMEQLQTTSDEYMRMRDRHASFFASFLQQRETDLKRRRQRESLDEITAELDNIRTSWQWLVKRENVEAISRSLESLFLFYEMRGLAKEGEGAFRRAAAAFDPTTTSPLDTTQTIVLGQLLGRQGYMAIRTGRYDEGIELLRRGTLLLRQVEAEAERELAWTLCYLGQEIYFQGDYSQAQQLLQESLQLATKADDDWLLGVVWQCLGQTAEFQGEYTEAEPYFQKSMEVYEKLGERRAKAFAQNNWGRVAYAIGEYDRAEQLINEALQMRQALRDKVGIAYSCLDLGKLATRRGDYEAARKQIERGLKICQEIGERDLMARCFNGLGAASRLLGNYAQAEAEHQQSLSIYNEIGVKREIPFTLNNLGRVAFDQGNYQRALEVFQGSLHLSQELENKTEMASAWRHLGHVAGVREQDVEAQRYYRQALEIVTKTGEAPVALDVFLGWAGLLRRNHPTQAVELFSFVQQHSAATHETREKAHQRLLDTAAGLPAEAISQAQSRGQSLEWQARAIRLIESLANVN